MGVFAYSVTMVGVASALIGVFFLGRDNGYSAGLSDGSAVERLKHDDAAQRDETLAKLLAVVNQPIVRAALPEEAREAIKEADEQVSVGQLDRAREAIANVDFAPPEPCFPQDVAIVVRNGQAGPVCNAPVELQFAENTSFGGGLAVKYAVVQPGNYSSRDRTIQPLKFLEIYDGCTIFLRDAVASHEASDSQSQFTVQIDCARPL